MNRTKGVYNVYPAHSEERDNIVLCIYVRGWFLVRVCELRFWHRWHRTWAKSAARGQVQANWWHWQTTCHIFAKCHACLEPACRFDTLHANGLFADGCLSFCFFWGQGWKDSEKEPETRKAFADSGVSGRPTPYQRQRTMPGRQKGHPNPKPHKTTKLARNRNSSL